MYSSKLVFPLPDRFAVFCYRTVVKSSDEVVLEAASDMLRTIPEEVEDEQAIMNPPQLPSGAQPPKRLFTFASLMRADPASQSISNRDSYDLPGIYPGYFQTTISMYPCLNQVYKYRHKRLFIQIDHNSYPITYIRKTTLCCYA